MRWYLNPFRIRDAVADVKRIHRGGGPRSIALRGFTEPEGWIIPHTTAEVEVAAKDGTLARFEPELPLPLPLAYGYRLGNALGAPLISGFDPTRLRVRLRLPR